MVIALGLGPGLSGCEQQAGKANAEAGARERPPHLVAIVTAARQAGATELERPATLRHRRVVRIHSQEEGRVEEIRTYEGDRVRAGDLLVRLDDALIAAERDKALANRDQARLDLERLEGLERRRAAAQDEVAQAQTALALAQAELSIAETRLDYTRILAPFAAVVTERLVEPGDFVAKNTHLTSLADPASLVARVRVSELTLPQLTEGDRVAVRIDALGEDPHPGRILRIHPVVEEASRQGIVEVALDPLPTGARAGQFARVTLSTGGAERLMLPFQSLQRDRAGEFVWIVSASNEAVRRPVETGLRIADGVEILAGLQVGERVIVRGLMGLFEGKGVQVVQR